jgi:oligopeptide transport system ATP-binding protein
MTEPVLTLENVTKTFSQSRSLWDRARRRPAAQIHAVRGVSLEIADGEVFGLVGESGSGKTTLVRMIAGLAAPDGGALRFRGKDLLGLSRAERRRIQMVFQNPYGSLNPRLTVGFTLAEPLRVFGIVPEGEEPKEVARLLEQVGLPADFAGRYPAELSGGQRQRVAIARALSVRPEVLIAGEVVSGLDASVRAQVLNLFADLRKEHGFAMIFIAHDIGAADYLSDRIGVMQEGRLVEVGPATDVLGAPEHPYTKALLAAVPSLRGC